MEILFMTTNDSSSEGSLTAIISGTSSIFAASVSTIVIGIVSFAIGGYVAGRLAGSASRWASAVHGLASFSLAALIALPLDGALGLPLVTGILDQAMLANLAINDEAVSLASAALTFFGFFLLVGAASASAGIVGGSRAQRVAERRSALPSVVEETPIETSRAA